MRQLEHFSSLLPCLKWSGLYRGLFNIVSIKFRDMVDALTSKWPTYWAMLFFTPGLLSQVCMTHCTIGRSIYAMRLPRRGWIAIATTCITGQLITRLTHRNQKNSRRYRITHCRTEMDVGYQFNCSHVTEKCRNLFFAFRALSVINSSTWPPRKVSPFHSRMFGRFK